MLKKASALVKANDLIAILDYGSELNDEIKTGLIELETLKSYVRDEAEDRHDDGKGEASPIKLSHSYGKTSVSIPAKKWKSKKGMDALELEEKLPEEDFDMLFDTPRTAVPKADFADQLKKLSKEHRDIVKRYMEYVAAGPSVTFPSVPAKLAPVETVIAKVTEEVPVATEEEKPQT